MKIFISVLVFITVSLIGGAHAKQIDLVDADVLEDSLSLSDNANSDEEEIDVLNASTPNCHNKPCKKLTCKFVEKEDVDCFAINEEGEKFKASGYGRPRRIQDRAVKKCRNDRSSNHCIALGCIM